MDQLAVELAGFEGLCRKRGVRPAVRLNVISDVAWERVKATGGTLFQLFPEIQFYDYTKRPVSRLDYVRDNVPNYHLTWSYSEASEKYSAQLPGILAAGHNAAVVFDTKKGQALPDRFRRDWYIVTHPVIDGDLNDLRFLDPSPCVVGLRAKGKARHDRSGFVVRDS